MNQIDSLDFERGMREGRECFYDVYGLGELPTPREVVSTIEENLSPQALMREQVYAQVAGLDPIPYSYRVGFVLSWLGTFVSAN